MSFIQDPRVRQRWNQISHNAEAVTENAAAGIWTFQHRYITPCLSSLGHSLDSCTSVCFGDREDRARRARERDRGARRTRAEYTFDFYDDWEDADDEIAGAGNNAGRGLLSGWGGGRSEDWDRLVAGTGGGRSRHAGANATGDVVDQPRRKRGMSYGTRGVRRKAPEEEDPTIIPSTAPLGFLGRLPFKIGGTLRYKPSAANLRDHPGGAALPENEDEEHEPLLGRSDDDGDQQASQSRRTSPTSRPRSNTVESGETSSSFRSRGDLFPSDGEGDEDAVPLDDEFAVALDRVDDRSSNKTRSSKGKRPADKDRESGGGGMYRTVSRTTMSSAHTHESAKSSTTKSSRPISPAVEEDLMPPATPSIEDLQREERQAEMDELEEIERRRRAASQLALQRGLNRDGVAMETPLHETKGEVEPHALEESDSLIEQEGPMIPSIQPDDSDSHVQGEHEEVKETKPLPIIIHQTPQPHIIETPADEEEEQEEFVPARLPHFR
ncbi:hypothetical protein B0T19DRAFT_168146 [Cercophora scortea]|uniref:Uncharacterized protein n=1 Tax=Cercophora scortea TaxID=314031 RepID=A0AAE0IMA2_9PEZI|nr:hypothetical protein B0T19DRAFT_168146 [Cercophora scortea]